MSLRGGCYDGMCGGCDWCRPELRYHCPRHVGQPEDDCEICEEERLADDFEETPLAAE